MERTTLPPGRTAAFAGSPCRSEGDQPSVDVQAASAASALGCVGKICVSPTIRKIRLTWSGTAARAIEAPAADARLRAAISTVMPLESQNVSAARSITNC